MKLSVSLSNDDAEFLDQDARTEGYDSRSAVVHRAVRADTIRQTVRSTGF